MYYVYMILCEDGSHYTGLCRDMAKRLREHVERLPSCAKYTRTHHAVRLDALWMAATRSDAARLEALIKRLTKAQKRALIAAPEGLGSFFGDKLDASHYEVAEISAF